MRTSTFAVFVLVSLSAQAQPPLEKMPERGRGLARGIAYSGAETGRGLLGFLMQGLLAEDFGGEAAEGVGFLGEAG
jgi:hypothetical protein